MPVVVTNNLGQTRALIELFCILMLFRFRDWTRLEAQPRACSRRANRLLWRQVKAEIHAYNL